MLMEAQTGLAENSSADATFFRMTVAQFGSAVETSFDVDSWAREADCIS